MATPEESLKLAESMRVNLYNVLSARDDNDILKKYRIMFRGFDQSDKQLLSYYPKTLETFKNYENFNINHKDTGTLKTFASVLFHNINHEINIMKKCLNFDPAVDMREAVLHDFSCVPYYPMDAYCRGGSDEAFMEYDRYSHEQQFIPYENPADILQQNARQMRKILGDEEYNQRLQMFSSH